MSSDTANNKHSVHWFHSTHARPRVPSSAPTSRVNLNQLNSNAPLHLAHFPFEIAACGNTESEKTRTFAREYRALRLVYSYFQEGAFSRYFPALFLEHDRFVELVTSPLVAVCTRTRVAYYAAVQPGLTRRERARYAILTRFLRRRSITLISHARTSRT